ncbi:MAG: 23S rRNA (guanosine(2251)-2'-O)-methyltransferase RlmB [Pseudomonadota bacterium]
MAITLYGIHPVLEALKKRPRAFHRIILAKQREEGSLREIAARAETSSIRLQYDALANLTRLASSEQHQGVVAEVEPFPLADCEMIIAGLISRQEAVFFLVLDSIQDPHNFGALIRSAVCSGVQAVLFPKDRSAQLTGSVAKASAGAIEHTALCRVVNIAAALESLKKNNIWIVGTAPRSRQTIYEFDFNLNMALVIGSEGKGMRQLIEKKCDFPLSIPLEAGFDSLNASAAGAVVLFEALRQRKYNRQAPSAGR